MPTFCGGYLAAAIAAAVVLGPGLTVSPEQVSTLGYYGSDYEHQLCGQLGKRDMRRRAFTYYLQPHNLSSGVCVSECPALADELICDYTYQQSETKRSQHGKRCFAQLRTRASFLTCLPIDPGAASTVDAWLTAHTWDQIGADTLEASGVLFSCWCAAGLAGYLCLLGLRWLPRTTLFASLMGSLILAPAFGALLLSHGYDELASARQHATLGGAIITRDRRAAQAALAAGWVAVLSGVVLLVSLALRARHAPLAAAVLDAASHALQGLPASLLLLPLYVAVATGGVLVSWLSSLAFYATPSPHTAALPATSTAAGGGGGVAAPLWAWSALPVLWLLALLAAWEWSAVSGAVATWYAHRRAAPSANGRPARLALWRAGCLSLEPAHVDSLGAAAALLPLSGLCALLLPDVGTAPRRDASPVSRLTLAASQRPLRAARAVADLLHPGAIVQLVLRSKIAWTQQQLKGGYGPSYGTMGAASEADPAAGHWAAGGMAAAEAGSAGGEAEEAEVEDGLWVAAGRCSQLYASTPTRLASCRGHTHFFLELSKGAIAGGCSLVGWMWLTDPGAPPLLTSLWPLLLLLLGCYAMASAGISLYQAAVETTLQCYCEESRDLSQVAQQHQQQRAAAAKA